jgi:hypothetical protein
MMPTSIIDNDNHATSLAPVTEELLEEAVERCSIEFVSLQSCHQTAIMVGHRPKDGNRLACGCMQQRWIALFGWHPHQASGAMLLEMAFVFKPQVNV